MTLHQLDLICSHICAQTLSISSVKDTLGTAASISTQHPVHFKQYTIEDVRLLFFFLGSKVTLVECTLLIKHTAYNQNVYNL